MTIAEPDDAAWTAFLDDQAAEWALRYADSRRVPLLDYMAMTYREWQEYAGTGRVAGAVRLSHESLVGTVAWERAVRPLPEGDFDLAWDITDPWLLGALLRGGHTTESLRGLSATYLRSPSWHGLLELQGVGPVRMLRLVNAARERGSEFRWFAWFDRVSARWAALDGHHRIPSRLG